MDVSVIVPLYKGAKYVNKIYEMIKRNILYSNEKGKEFEWELIFVNDYPAEKVIIPKVENVVLVLNKDNQGIHQTRINGLKKAKGEYILFLDQDDNINDNYLYSQMIKIGLNDAIICDGFYRDNKLIYGSYEKQKKAVDFFQYLSQDIVIISPGQVLLRKKIIPDNWVNNILKYNGSDDVFLWIMLLKSNVNFAINTEPLYTHVEDGTNTSINFLNMRNSVCELKHMVLMHCGLKNSEYCVFSGSLDKRINKYNQYIDIIENWKMIMSKIYKCIGNKGEKKLAIHGYGVLGQMLLKELQKNEVVVDYVIDKNAQQYSLDFNVHSLVEIEKIKDAGIVISTVVFEKDIRKKLEDIFDNAEVILLSDFL